MSVTIKKRLVQLEQNAKIGQATIIHNLPRLFEAIAGRAVDRFLAEYERALWLVGRRPDTRERRSVQAE